MKGGIFVSIKLDAAYLSSLVHPLIMFMTSYKFVSLSCTELFMRPVSLPFFTSRPFLKTAGGIVLGSVAVSAVSAVSADVLPYISVAIKASFLKLRMCNICKNNIAKMFLDF